MDLLDVGRRAATHPAGAQGRAAGADRRGGDDARGDGAGALDRAGGAARAPDRAVQRAHLRVLRDPGRGDPVDEQRWIPRIRETERTPFLLRDASGDALVDPRGARVSTVPLVTKSGTFNDADARERAFLASRNFAHRGTFFNKALRYTEIILAPDALVAVLGTPVRDTDPDGAARVGGYRDLPPTRAHLSSTRDAPLLISDHPDAVAGGAPSSASSAARTAASTRSRTPG